LEDADVELHLLSNAEGIKAALQKVSYELQEGEEPMVPRVKTLANGLQSFASYHPGIPDLVTRLQSVQLELQDLSAEVDRLSDHVQYDARRIEQLNDRIALGYKLLKKHGAKITADLIVIKKDLEEKLQSVFNIDELIASKENMFTVLEKQAYELAAKLSANRIKEAEPLQTRVNELLAKVGMPNARLRVDISVMPTLQQTGVDKIEFLFDANKSNRFEPVKKVASGGELSRLMLCLKSLVAESLDLPTMIFDEIDTGISGEAAKQVGIIMKGLAKKRQVISITHQPQIAGKADAHFFVYKQTKGEKIKTNIRRLSEEERVTAIAKMLSGEKPTAAAIENAREMVAG
jgi:DNA repair protein RecN (Recombination protein N)